MKKINLVIAFGVVFLLTGCIPHVVPDLEATVDNIIANKTKSYEINGTEYLPDFYADYMYVDDFDVIAGETVTIGFREFAHIENDFDIYQADIGNKQNGKLFCSEDDFEAAKEFYASSENYTCRYVKSNKDSYNYDRWTTGVEVDYADFEELVETFESFDPIYLKKHTEECDLKLENEEFDVDRCYYIQEISNDGLLHSRRVDLYYYDGELYYYVLSMGGATDKELEGHYYMKLSDHMNEVFLPIFQEGEEE